MLWAEEGAVGDAEEAGEGVDGAIDGEFEEEGFVEFFYWQEGGVERAEGEEDGECLVEGCCVWCW